MAMWKMDDETQKGFYDLARRFNFGKGDFAPISLAIVKRYIELNPEFKIIVTPQNGNTKIQVIETEYAAQ